MIVIICTNIVYICSMWRRNRKGSKPRKSSRSGPSVRIQGRVKKLTKNRSSFLTRTFNRFGFRSSRKGTVSKRRKRGLSFKLLLSYTLILLIIITVPYLMYRSLNSVIETRKSKTEEIVQIEGEVVGFSDVPEFPESEFIFRNELDESYVQDFLESGRSIYRLPSGVTFTQVIDFYKSELENREYKMELEVPRADEDRLYGYYWISPDGKSSIRIYDKTNDIWYERLTPEQAASGLAERVTAARERELIISSRDGEDLLPDFPWELKVPNEYTLVYFPTDIDEHRGIVFTEIVNNQEYTLEPVSSYQSFDESLDPYLEQYVSILNVREENSNFKIQNTIEGRSSRHRYLKGTLSGRDDTASVYILMNSRSELAYAIYHISDVDEEFVNFLLDNLKDKETGVTQ